MGSAQARSGQTERLSKIRVPRLDGTDGRAIHTAGLRCAVTVSRAAGAGPVWDGACAGSM
jgi:hypothetical protein